MEEIRLIHLEKEVLKKDRKSTGLTSIGKVPIKQRVYIEK